MASAPALPGSRDRTAEAAEEEEEVIDKTEIGGRRHSMAPSLARAAY